MKNKLTLLLTLLMALCLVFALSSCGENGDTDTNTETETQAQNDSNTDTSTDTSADTETDTEIGSDTETDSDSDTETDTSTESGTDTDTDTDTDEPGHVHVEEIIPAVEPTCTETGLTEGIKCSLCGEVLLEQETVEAVGHHYEGSYECTRCDFELKASAGLEFVFDTTKTSCSVTGIGTCADENVVIPYEHEGATVVGIVSNAFYFLEQLKSLTIPDSVTTISDGALPLNINLEKIMVGEGNQHYKEIDGNLYTKNGETLVQYASGKKDAEYIVPKGVKTIAPYALYGVERLESIDFGTDLTTISDYAVSTCPSLKTIVIPEQVEYIGEYSFYYSTGATSLVLKAKNVTIGEKAFGHSFRLVEIYNLSGQDLTSYMDEESEISCKIIEHTSLDEESVMKTEGDFVFVEKDSNVYLVDYLGTSAEVVLPQSYQAKSYMINKGAFYFNLSIERVVIPQGVTGVGEQAFQACDNLKYIEVADSVDVIGDRAFCIGESLEKIIISNNALNVSSRAFDSCESATAFVKGENKNSTFDALLESKTSAVYYFSEAEPTTEGNYWHYVDGVVTIWE